VNGKRLLLVEGKDDKHIVYHLAKHHSIPDVFDVEECDNDNQLLTSIPVRFKGSEIERLAVILDADQGVSQRWDQLSHLLGNVPGVSFPRTPNPQGTIIHTPDSPLFGVWLMPNNSIPGMMEDFLSFLVPDDDPLLPQVDEFLRNIPDNIRRFPDKHLSKARIHSWLAIQKEPGKRLGTAITARYLDASLDVVKPFVKWLRAVLVD